MANKRMGTRLITGTIDFLNLPKAAQALYQQCTNESDDDGIVDARLIMRVGNFRKRDLEALLSNDYVRLINAEKSIVWVTNWQRYNTIKPGRGTPSVYREDLLRSVPDIKNALFKPKIDKKCRTNDSVELERESESELDQSMLEPDVESESEPEEYGVNTARMASPHGKFFMESCPDVLKNGMHNLVCMYGDTPETRLMSVVTIKLFRLEMWKPDTCFRLAKRFTELNSAGLSRKWKDDKWQSMLEGFVESEQTGSDYDEWMESCEDGEDLPFG